MNVIAVIFALSVSVAQSQLFTGVQQSSMTCRQRCPRNWRPVCSVTGNTHWNECVLRCRGEWKQCIGPCPCGVGGLRSMLPGLNLQQQQAGAAGQTLLLNQLLGAQAPGNMLANRGAQGLLGLNNNNLLSQGNMLGQTQNLQNLLVQGQGQGLLGQGQGLLGQGLMGGNIANNLLGQGNGNMLGLGGLGQGMQNTGLLGQGASGLLGQGATGLLGQGATGLFGQGAGLVPPNTMLGQTLLGQGTGGLMGQMLGQSAGGLMGQGVTGLGNPLGQGLLGQAALGLAAQGAGTMPGQAQTVDPLTQASAVASLMMGGEGGERSIGGEEAPTGGLAGMLAGAGIGAAGGSGIGAGCSSCSNNYAPVCTTDGRTFNNICSASCAGGLVACQFACPCP